MDKDGPSDEVEFKDWKPKMSSLALAELIVDALIDGGVVAKNVFEQAAQITAAELEPDAKHPSVSALASSLIQALVEAHLVLPSDIESGCAITVEELDVRRVLESYSSLR